MLYTRVVPEMFWENDTFRRRRAIDWASVNIVVTASGAKTRVLRATGPCVKGTRNHRSGRGAANRIHKSAGKCPASVRQRDTFPKVFFSRPSPATRNDPACPAPRPFYFDFNRVRSGPTRGGFGKRIDGFPITVTLYSARFHSHRSGISSRSFGIFFFFFNAIRTHASDDYNPASPRRSGRSDTRRCRNSECV